MYCITFISLLLWSASKILFFLKEKESNSNNPFECGMDSLISLCLPLYMHFFFIAILFLVFDIELALSVPLIQFPLKESIWNLFWIIFFMILFMGLFLEVYLGTLEWKE